jgi:hypothetical protein
MTTTQITATRYGAAEACTWLPVEFTLTKDEFLENIKKHKYEKILNHEYSHPLGVWVVNMCYKINYIKAFRVEFSDGSIYDLVTSINERIGPITLPQ